MFLLPLFSISDSPTSPQKHAADAAKPDTMGEIMIDDPPPSYHARDNHFTFYKTASELVIQEASAFFKEPPLPPEVKYLVRTDSEPSPWKLLSGPIISNAITEDNPSPSRKRRFRVVYPPEYEDVYLHKSVWTAHAEALPRYHVELYGKERYEPEPIVILGPLDHEQCLTNEAMRLAMSNTPRVVARIREEVTQISRFTSFCESEYWSWDWSCKTAAARHDMQSFITRARSDGHRTAGLVEKLECFIEYVGKEESYEEELSQMRRSLDEASIRLSRLRL